MQENESNIGRGCVAILLNIQSSAGLELRKDTASWIFHQFGSSQMSSNLKNEWISQQASMCNICSCKSHVII